MPKLLANRLCTPPWRALRNIVYLALDKPPLNLTLWGVQVSNQVIKRFSRKDQFPVRPNLNVGPHHPLTNAALIHLPQLSSVTLKVQVPTLVNLLLTATNSGVPKKTTSIGITRIKFSELCSSSPLPTVLIDARIKCQLMPSSHSCASSVSSNTTQSVVSKGVTSFSSNQLGHQARSSVLINLSLEGHCFPNPLLCVHLNSAGRLIQLTKAVLKNG